MTTAYINRIATAVPPNNVHQAFVKFAKGMIVEDRMKAIFSRMAGKAEIETRYSVLSDGPSKNEDVDAWDFYRLGHSPDTAARMAVYEKHAPVLMRQAVDALHISEAERDITHIVVTSCTGLYAPGLDFDIIDHLGLPASVERTVIAFMGCYAAINALKTARHIVRSEPDARVLVVNLELCTLHLQETQDLEQVLSFLVFADGCAASLISAAPTGFAMESFRALGVPDTRGLITWRVGQLGFDMLLSGKVPASIGQALRGEGETVTGGPKSDIDLWAVHPGGRSVLDAVADGLELAEGAMRASRDILARFGNMSSATIMFVLQSLMHTARSGERGCALSFGPGLTAETMLFRAA